VNNDLSMCLPVCYHFLLTEYQKKPYEQMLVNFFRGAGCGRRSIRLDFGGDANSFTDTVLFVVDLLPVADKVSAEIFVVYHGDF